MTTAWTSDALSAGVALLPVIGFLVVLLFLDSYRLIRPVVVLLLVAAGVVAAGVALVVNTTVLDATGWSLATYSHGAGPAIEEALKAVTIVFLIRRERIGFLVDAAIVGFAIGSGFAIVENLDYLHLDPQAGLATWIVRGFGTALMHGGATAIFGATALVTTELRPRAFASTVFLPGYAIAVTLHAVFNLFARDAMQATIAVLVGIPLLMLSVFQLSERRLRAWIGTGFDHDAEMLSLLASGAYSTSPAGRYLGTIRDRFEPFLRFDALCYLRLSSKLSLRSKGLLMLRENELPTPPLDAATRASLVEMKHLETTIGPTGLAALKPLLPPGGRGVWQRLLLEATDDAAP